jgi:flavin reductase (DIM6/NTAB) family NADH-FMN oxidoreductase RutF
MMSATPVSHDAFRRAFRGWASGVSIVSAAMDGKLHGMTVSSLVSVSLEPPLLSVCCDLETRTLELIHLVRRFGVTVLGQAQHELSNRFASKLLEDVRFEGQAYHLGPHGSPLLDGGVAEFECTLHDVVRAGDHEIVIGEVVHAVAGGGEPLVYFDGRYRSLG